MIPSTTLPLLQNLRDALNRIMKSGHTKNKYVAALDDVIEEITQEECQLITSAYVVNVREENEGSVVVDVYSTQGPLIDSIEYDTKDILATDEEAGEA
tara:strand:- start:898 stop:1191 length:294 start_codon:yes stop_codon:yes gene_type:complete